VIGWYDRAGRWYALGNSIGPTMQKALGKMVGWNEVPDMQYDITERVSPDSPIRRLKL